MTRIMMIAITVFFCTSVHADTMNGKKLFDDAQCMKCHNT